MGHSVMRVFGQGPSLNKGSRPEGGSMGSVAFLSSSGYTDSITPEERSNRKMPGSISRSYSAVRKILEKSSKTSAVFSLF